MADKTLIPSNNSDKGKKSIFSKNKSNIKNGSSSFQSEQIRLIKERKRLEELIEKKIEEADRKEEKRKSKAKKRTSRINNTKIEDTSMIPTIPLKEFVENKKTNSNKKVSFFEKWMSNNDKNKKIEEKQKTENKGGFLKLNKLFGKKYDENKIKEERLALQKKEQELLERKRLREEKARREKEEKERKLEEEKIAFEKRKQELIQKKKEKREKERLEKEEKQRKREEERLAFEKKKQEAIDKKREIEEQKRLQREEKERIKQEKNLLNSDNQLGFENGSVKSESVDERKLKKIEEKRLAKEKKEEERLRKEEERKQKYKEKYEEQARRKREKEEKNIILINERREKEKRLKKEKEQARRERKEKALLIKKAQEESKTQARKERKKLKEKVTDWYNNLSFVRDRRNRKEMQRQTLLIDFEGADAVRSEEKIMYKYVAKNNETGKVETGMFAAFSKLDVHSFLLAEGYEVYEITPLKNFSKPITLFSAKFKPSELDFFLTQLSTFLRSGITLVESVKILSKQCKKQGQKNVYKSIIYELTMGENFSEALSKQGTIFPRLLINMIKTSELTGDLPETLDDMADYYREIEKTKKQMISAITYPAFVLCFAIAILIFIMVKVIPQFVSIYSDLDAGLPAITVAIIKISNFLQSYWGYLILGIIAFIFIFIILFKTIKVFKTVVQSIIMNLPVMGKIIIYNEVTMFTKTFASLLNHNVYITDCMEVLSKITNNEVYKMLIFDTITNLAKGEAISNSFKNHWAFPNIAYEMILTGEKTGQLGPMMDKVANYYQELHKNAVGQIKAFIEPVMIIILAAIVGVVLLSVVLPMFDMYQNIGA